MQDRRSNLERLTYF